jgi:ribosomal protein S18 acetylase RimI-like enzyme
MFELKIELRAVAAADADALADLRVAAMRPSLEAVGRFDPDRARRRLLDHFDPRHMRWIEADGGRVGLLATRAVDGRLQLDHLYLVPQAQGRGIGSAVMRTILAEADRAGHAVHVVALKGSRSNDFYRRHGFRLVDAEAEWDHLYVRLPQSRA